MTLWFADWFAPDYVARRQSAIEARATGASLTMQDFWKAQLTSILGLCIFAFRSQQILCD